MKVIISHDVDHLFWSDHLFDTYILGTTYRTIKDVLSGSINKEVFLSRMNFTKPLNQLDNLIETLIKYNIPSTFFFAMTQGLNLSYRQKAALPFISKISALGFEIGLHGIDFTNVEKMKKEKSNLETMLGHEIKGIRNHYLRKSDQTFSLMNRLGYKYDSTQSGVRKPYRIGDMWEIPISLMDVTLQRSVASRNLKDLQRGTLSLLEESLANELPYFVVNFHDVYYSTAYPHLRDWFDWILDEFQTRGYEPVSFLDAVKELDSLFDDSQGNRTN